MKKILITGAGGFIGKSLSARLEKTKNEIITLCKIPNENGSNFSEYIGDINDEKLISKLVSDVDIIIHLAAYLDIKSSFEKINLVYNTNIKGTFNILKNISFLRKKPHLLFLSSSVVYGNLYKKPIKESDFLNPFTPYAMSKASCEMMCTGFSNSYNIPITILRPFSVYGPNAPSHQVVPRIISQIQKTNKVIQNNPLEIRDFVYVDDVSDALMRAIKQKPVNTKIYNIGSGTSLSVNILIKKILKYFPKEIKLVNGKLTELNKRKSIADISLIKKELGWKPKISIDEGLSKIIQNIS